jgi:hypothetical protein
MVSYQITTGVTIHKTVIDDSVILVPTDTNIDDNVMLVPTDTNIISILRDALTTFYNVLMVQNSDAKHKTVSTHHIQFCSYFKHFYQHKTMNSQTVGSLVLVAFSIIFLSAFIYWYLK